MPKRWLSLLLQAIARHKQKTRGPGTRRTKVGPDAGRALCGVLNVPIKKGKVYAVITGDIVKSSKLDRDARRELFDAMQKIGGELVNWLGKEVTPYPFDIFSGDSWQVLLADPARALDAAVFYRVGLIAEMGAKKSKRKVDTRMAIALGEIDFVPGNRVSEGEGWAFRESGRALGEKKAPPLMRLQMQYRPEHSGWEDAVILLDTILRRRLTAPRALAIKDALMGLSSNDIARGWTPPISRSAVTKHLRSVDWEPIKEALEDFRSDVGKSSPFERLSAPRTKTT